MTSVIRGDDDIDSAELKAVPFNALIDLTGLTEYLVPGIPDWVTEIAFGLFDASTNGTSQVCIVLGTASGLETSGYRSSAGYDTGAGQNSSSTAAFILDSTGIATAGNIRGAAGLLKKVGPNAWVLQGQSTSDTVPVHFMGTKVLADVLTQLKLTTLGGVNTFDAGSQLGLSWR